MRNNIFPFLIFLGIITMRTKKVAAYSITLLDGKMKKRGCDAGGCGNFGASRDNGSRVHEGLDILCVPNAEVYAPFDGIVQRKVDPYGDGRFSGLQIYCPDRNFTVKIMYFSPIETLIGQIVTRGEVLGFAQNISTRYGSDVPPHLHIETIVNGQKVNPEQFLF